MCVCCVMLCMYLMLCTLFCDVRVLRYVRMCVLTYVCVRMLFYVCMYVLCVYVYGM